jgi:hypothetical protein
VLLQRQSSLQADNAEQDERIHALEKGRWPLPSVAVLVAIGSVMVTLHETLNR